MDIDISIKHGNILLNITLSEGYITEFYRWKWCHPAVEMMPSSDGISIIRWWKWCYPVVEMVSSSGGNDYPGSMDPVITTIIANKMIPGHNAYGRCPNT